MALIKTAWTALQLAAVMAACAYAASYLQGVIHV
jgi:hypothetical protein